MRQGLRCCYCRERLSDEERLQGDGRHCAKCTIQMSATHDQNSADFLAAFEPLLLEAAPDTKYIVANGAVVPRSKVPWSGYGVKCDGVLFISSWSLIDFPTSSVSAYLPSPDYAEQHSQVSASQLTAFHTDVPENEEGKSAHKCTSSKCKSKVN